MEYPKKVMKISELTQMGFPETFLREAYLQRDQTFAWKLSPKSSSPILFDTSGLEKYRLAKCKAR